MSLCFFLIWVFVYQQRAPAVALSIFGIVFSGEKILFFFRCTNTHKKKNKKTAKKTFDEKTSRRFIIFFLRELLFLSADWNNTFALQSFFFLMDGDDINKKNKLSTSWFAFASLGCLVLFPIYKKDYFYVLSDVLSEFCFFLCFFLKRKKTRQIFVERVMKTHTHIFEGSCDTFIPSLLTSLWPKCYEISLEKKS